MSELIHLGSVNERPKPPAPGDVKLNFSDKGVKELEALKSHYPNWKACILPGLWIAQREYKGKLTGEAIAELAVRLERSYAEIEGVATFYSMYNTQHDPGKHKLEVCTCLTCQVCGGYRILDLLKQKLGVEPGHVTPDGLFMIEEVECLNACDRAPLIQVGDQYYGPVDEAFLDKLIAELKSRPDSTVVKMADEIVQVHLMEKERVNS